MWSWGEKKNPSFNPLGNSGVVIYFDVYNAFHDALYSKLFCGLITCEVWPVSTRDLLASYQLSEADVTCYDGLRILFSGN